MPLFADGLKKIRKALELVEAGQPSPLVKVGRFSDDQIADLNEQRREDGLEPIDQVIVFNGKHLYRSRCLKDGYSIDEIIEQIESAFCPDARVCHDHSTVIYNPNERIDRKGVAVRDRIVFECSEKKPSPLLWSVIPYGDGRKKQ